MILFVYQYTGVIVASIISFIGLSILIVKYARKNRHHK